MQTKAVAGLQPSRSVPSTSPGRKTRFRLLARLYRVGSLSHWVPPKGFFDASYIASLPSQAFPGASDEVGGQPPVTKGIQPPPPEPDGHVCVHPALQYRVLRVKAESPIRATSTHVEPSTCPPSSCPGHYPRRWATTGTLSPWALPPVGDPVVVCLVRSAFRVSVRPLPLLIAGCVLPEDHG